MKMRLFLRRKESKLFGDGQLFSWFEIRVHNILQEVPVRILSKKTWIYGCDFDKHRGFFVSIIITPDLWKE